MPSGPADRRRSPACAVGRPRCWGRHPTVARVVAPRPQRIASPGGAVRHCQRPDAAALRHRAYSASSRPWQPSPARDRPRSAQHGTGRRSPPASHRPGRSRGPLSPPNAPRPGLRGGPPPDGTEPGGVAGVGKAPGGSTPCRNRAASGGAPSSARVGPPPCRRANGWSPEGRCGALVARPPNPGGPCGGPGRPASSPGPRGRWEARHAASPSGAAAAALGVCRGWHGRAGLYQSIPASAGPPLP